MVRIIGAVFSSLTIFILTRSLNGIEYGKYSLAITSISLFSVILFQWINVVISRYLSAHTKIVLDYSNKIFINLSSVFLFISILYGFIFENIYESLLISVGAISLGFFTMKTQIEISNDNKRSYNIRMFKKYIYTFIFVISSSIYFKKASITLLAFSIGTFISINLLYRVD